MRRTLMASGLVLLLVACSDDTTTSTEPGLDDAECPTDADTGWTDAVGCPVPTDVIKLAAGPADCGWELVDFLTVGSPLGEPISPGSERTYIWDPVNFLSYVDGGVRNRTVLVRDLAPSVVDSGFRWRTEELWHDPRDETVLYLGDGVRADRFELDEGDRIVCE